MTNGLEKAIQQWDHLLRGEQSISELRGVSASLRGTGFTASGLESLWGNAVQRQEIKITLRRQIKRILFLQLL